LKILAKLIFEFLRFIFRSKQDIVLEGIWKCHNLAYRAQQLRAFKEPEKMRDKTPKKYTKEDWLKEAKAFLEKIKSKRKSDSVLSGF
jgi:hypothetical protein